MLTKCTYILSRVKIFPTHELFEQDFLVIIVSEPDYGDASSDSGQCTTNLLGKKIASSLDYFQTIDSERWFESLTAKKISESRPSVLIIIHLQHNCE